MGTDLRLVFGASGAGAQRPGEGVDLPPLEDVLQLKAKSAR